MSQNNERHRRPVRSHRSGRPGAMAPLPRRRTPPGTAPGTLTAAVDAQASIIDFIGYGPEGVEQRRLTGIAEIKAALGIWPVAWINVSGLADLELVRGLGELFGLHRLALEDVVNLHQRPKAEEYDGYIFIAARMPVATTAPETEQITMFLGPKFLLSFQEQPGDCFDAVRKRIQDSRSLMRQNGVDYLAYTLLDAVIDGFFPVLEAYGEALEDVEMRVMSAPEISYVADIHALKRDLLMLRRAVWPVREMINALIRDNSPYLSAQTRLYLRDCYDHAIQIMDVIETYREIASGLVDIYLSSVSMKTNEIMKVLTIIATIFIPLSFIASFYGMNFNTHISPWNMPELSWYWGYPAVIALMVGVAGGLLYSFHRRNWISWPRKRRPDLQDMNQENTDPNIR